MVTAAEIEVRIEARNSAQAEVNRLKSQLSGLDKGMDGITSSMKSASSASSGFASSLKSVASAANPIPRAFGGITSAVGTTTKALGAIGLAGMGIQTVTGAVKGLGNALGFGLQNELEQVRASMNAFFKDSAKTEEALRMVRQEANSTPFAFREMAVAMSSLLPVAKQSNTEIMDLVKTAEILAASNPFEGLEGASFALREAMSGDFTSIIERFNLSRTTINKLKDEGVPALEIVRRAMGEMGFDADLVAAKAQTLSGRWSTFNDTLDTLRLKLSEGLFEAANRGLDIMSGALDKNMPKLEAMATTIGEGIGTALGFALDKIVEFAGAVETHWGTISAILSTGWDVLRTVGETVFSVVVSAVQTAAALIMQAWGPVSATLVAVWDTIGPKATAAGAAIVSGLTAAQTWITDTLLPKIGELAGAAWDAIGPRAAAAATAITDALGSIVSWVESNWPAVKEQLSGIFDRLAETAGPAIEEVKQRLSELEQRMGETDQQSRELFREGSAFDRLAEQISKVDFSPLTSQFAPLKNEAQAWVDFLGQDFGPAMDGARNVLGFVKQAILEQIPDWANLGNAAKAAGAIVVTAADLMSSIIAGASTVIRGALQAVIDILAGEWQAALLGAAQGVINLISHVSPGVAIVEGLGRAASAAAGFIRDLANGIGSLAGTASGVIGPLNSVLGVLNSIGGAKGALDFILPGSLPPLAQGISDVGDQAGQATPSLAQLASDLAGIARQAQPAMATLRDLKAELRDLKLALALDPENKGLQEAVKNTQNLVTAQESLVSSLRDSSSALLDARSALDGFNDAAAAQSTAGKFGKPIQDSLFKAVSTDDPAAGGALFGNIQKMIDEATKLGVPLAAEMGQAILGAAVDALGNPTAANIQTVLDGAGVLLDSIQQRQAEAAEASKASATAFWSGYTGEEAQKALGSVGSTFEALGAIVTEGTAKASESAGVAVAGLMDRFRELPEQLQATLGPQFKAALDAFLTSPTAETLENLRPVLGQIENAFALIPKNFDKLSPEMQAAVLRLVDQVNRGEIPLRDAIQRWEQAMKLIPANMADLAPNVRANIQTIIDAFVDLGLSAEDAEAKVKGLLETAAAASAATADAARSGASAARSSGGGGGGGNTSGLPGSQPLAPMTQANLVALGHAGNADPAVLAALVQEQELLMRGAREEYERLTAADRQREKLRQVTLRVGQAGGQEQANRILTELSSGLIDIDEAIRMLLQLLRDLARDGLKAKVLQSDVVAAARDGQTEYERGRWG